MKADSKSLDQTTQVRRSIWAFAVHVRLADTLSHCAAYNGPSRKQLILSLRGTDTLPGVATLSKLVRLPFEKGVYSKRKEFAPSGSKFLPFRVDQFFKWGLVRRKGKLFRVDQFFQMGFGAQKRKQGVTKSYLPCINNSNLPSIFTPLKPQKHPLKCQLAPLRLYEYLNDKIRNHYSGPMRVRMTL